MRRLILCISLCGVILFCIPAVSRAQEEEITIEEEVIEYEMDSLLRRLGGGVYGTLALYSPEECQNPGGGGGVYLKFMALEYFAVEVSGGMEVFKFDSNRINGNGGGSASGVVYTFPTHYTAMLTYPVANRFYPYFGAGFTAIFMAGEPDGTCTNGATAEIKFDSAVPGAHIAMGGDWQITENWVANFDAKFIWAESRVSATASSGDINHPKQKIDHWALRLGVAYYF